MKILFTAFNSFPGVQENPTEVSLREWEALPGIKKEILNVDYDYCKNWSLSDESDYSIIIHLGVAVNSQNFRLESKAKNFIGGKEDNQGNLLTGLIKDGETSLKSKFNCLKLQLELQERGFDVSVSDDAGAYLCNYIYYLSLHKYERTNTRVFYEFIDSIQIRCYYIFYKNSYRID